MYGFARPLQGLCALALLQRFTPGSLARETPAVATLDETDDLVAENVYFSRPWWDQYKGGDTGCQLGIGRYIWRDWGFGANINSMLSAWVYFIAVEDWAELSLISDHHQFQRLNCFNESEGLVSHGWGCLFSEIPHVCVMDTAKAWKKHMHSANVSDEDQHTAGNLDIHDIRKLSSEVVDSFQELDVDNFGAVAMMAKYLWSYMTPWLRHDVDAVIHAEKGVEGLPCLGMHVRRGDKITQHEAEKVEVKEYLKAAVVYVEEDTTLGGVDGIKAIRVASDDPTVVDEVRTLAPNYFPSVSSEAIVFVFGRPAGESSAASVITRSQLQDYESFVYLLADLEKLAAADVFVGTFTSNIGRLVALKREGLGKPRNSSISVDMESWYFQ